MGINGHGKGKDGENRKHVLKIVGEDLMKILISGKSSDKEIMGQDF